jgi:hypothetical protein
MNNKQDKNEKPEAKKIVNPSIKAKKPVTSNNSNKNPTKVEQKKVPAQIQPKKVVNPKFEVKKVSANTNKADTKKTSATVKKFETKNIGNNKPSGDNKITANNKPKTKIVKH